MHSALLSVLLATPLCFSLPAVSNQTTSYGNLDLELSPELASKWYQPYETQSNNTPPIDPASVYSCAGPDMNDYPKRSQWLSFDSLWTINEPLINQKNNGTNYGDFIKSAIQNVSTESKVDSRLILVIIMQESTGGVHEHCTGGGDDCGLMQFRGGSTFDKSDPAGSILRMIRDAVFGAGEKPGFYHYFTGTDLGWIQPEFYGNPFAAAHLYNGGSISSSNLNTTEGDIEMSRVYANDIASRLLGWNGYPAGCRLSAGEGDASKFPDLQKCKDMRLRSADKCGTWA